jgi:hypothetical protein
MATLNAKPIDDEPDEKLDASSVDDPGVPADVVEAPGIVRDLFSNKTWTLPSDSLSDAGLATYRSPRDFKKDPNFHYQVCRVEDELNEYIGQDFVPVTRKELGMSDFVHPGQPSPMDDYYVIDGKDVVIKIPREIADRRYAAMKRLADAAKEGVNRGDITDANGTTHIALDAGGQSAGPVERKLRSRTTRHEPTRDELD